MSIRKSIAAPFAIAALAVAGFGSGPVFPLIIAIGGGLNPRGAAALAGTLTSAGVVGGLVYPPLVGLISGSVGLGAGLLGAAALSMVAAGAVLAAVRVAPAMRLSGAS
jgi:fucose permease